MRHLWIPLLVLGACKKTDLDDAIGPPSITTLELDDGRTHQPYTAWLDADQGVPPLLWTASSLPPGLAMNPGGAITGIPTEKGTTDVTVTVTDDKGRSDTVDLSLEVKWAQGSVDCDRERSGTFDEAAAIDWYEVDWDAEGGLAWIEIDLPPPEITTLMVNIGDDIFDLYLALPGTPEGNTNLERNYINTYGFPGYPLRIDLGSYPDLESYRAYGEPIQLLIAANGPADWNVGVDCLDVPVIVSPSTTPVQVGEALNINYSIHGEQDTVTWELIGDLPSWASFDPESGRITGVAQELGTWEYTLEATDAQGRTGLASSGFGVYETTPIACDQTEIWQSGGYFDGILTGMADPGGYTIFELPLDGSVSGVTAWLDAPDGGILSAVDPDAEPYDAGYGYEYDFGAATLSVDIGPDTWPPMGLYDELGVLHTVAASVYGGGPDVTFWFECDPLPRPDLFGLPVLEVGLSEQHQLDAIGGTGPYTWSATGLPPEVTLDPTGLLLATAPVAGSWTVDVTVTDSLAQETTTPLDLFVGTADACQGHPVLTCGGSLDGELAGVFADTICIEPGAADGQLVVLTATPLTTDQVDVWVANPGSEPGMGDRYLIAPRQYLPDAGVIDLESAPPLWAYADQPIFVTVSSINAGTYQLTADCY